MKKMKNLVVCKLLLFVFVFTSCSNKKPDLPDGFVRISGKVDNFKKGDSLILMNFFPQDVLKHFNVQADGSFTDTLYVKNKTSFVYPLELKTTSVEYPVPVNLYLYPNDDIEFSFDMNKAYRTLRFEGKGKGVAENSYHYDWNPRLLRSLFGTLSKSLLVSDSISPSKLKEKLEVYNKKYDAILAKMEDPEQRNRYKGNNQRFCLSILQNHIYGKIFRDFIVSKETVSKEDLDGMIERYKKEALPFIEKYCPQSILKKSEGYKAKCESTVESNIYSVRKNFESLVYKRAQSGVPCPKFSDYENYSGGTSSLEDFKGKYVYIDLWATWCGPCKAEIPFLQKVEKQYHDKNIAFVSISLDKKSAHEIWRKMVKDKSLSGVQLFAKNQDFASALKVTGIPRFIFVDPEGNFITADAPRPSDPELIKLFDKYNI